MQLEENASVKTVLQKQAEIMTLLQNGELPNMPQENTMESEVSISETKLNHLLTTCDSIHKATTTATSVSSFDTSISVSPSSTSVSVRPKTYVQVTAQHSLTLFTLTKSAGTQNDESKAVQKSDKKQRLLVKVRKEAKKNFNGLQLRNLINDAFAMYNITTKAVVGGVFKSFSEQSIIVTTIADFSSNFLTGHKDIWPKGFSESINSDLQLEKDEKWNKFVLHNIPIKLFNIEDSIKQQH